MAYTKAQKKAQRNNVYQAAKLLKNNIKERYPNPNSMAKLEMLFPQAIMDANFRMSLEIHRKLHEYEEKGLDLLVFNEKEKYTSENVRIGCKNIKINYENRKVLLRGAMTCDAKYGYWQLSK